MSYLDIGFDENLSRSDDASQGTQELDPLQFDSFTQQISASKLQGGVASSPDGKIKLDLDGGVFKVSNGVQDLIQLGILPDGSIGLLIKDNDGNVIQQTSGTINILQSSNKHMVQDFNGETITISDDSLNPIVLLGKIG